MTDFYSTPFGSILSLLFAAISIYYIVQIAKWPGNVFKKFIYLILVPFMGILLWIIFAYSFEFLIPPLYPLFELFSGYIIIGFSISFHLLADNRARKFINKEKHISEISY